MNIAGDSCECTPLIGACQKGHKEVVQLLIKHSGPNIDLNARSNGNIYADIPEQTDDEDGEDNRHGWTAFVWTCYYGQKDDV